jgi:hypothetical protein
MSKINQIQQAIFEMSGGEFQKLADQYLVEKGFVSVNFIGSVVGSNKVRKGTPDTLIALPNGNYIFAEHNTQNSDVFSKLKSDLSKCFEEKKTGVPIERIERVVFCFWARTSFIQPHSRRMFSTLVGYLATSSPGYATVSLIPSTQF